jgi:four helix bundle protein
MKSFRDLRIWHESIDLVVHIYAATTNFPSDERFGLTAQLRRAATSIPSNIAEGQGRMTRGEKRQFLGNARGSLYELETQIVIASRLGYLDAEASAQLSHCATELGRGLSGFLNFVSRQRTKRRRTDNGQRTTDNGQRTTDNG